MTRVITLVVVLACANASASAEELRVKAHEIFSFEVPAATAAFLVDSSLADVSLKGQQIQIAGRRTGMTTLSVVTPRNVLTFDLIVSPATNRVQTSGVSATSAATGYADAAYNSETRRITTSVTSTTGSGPRATRLSATSVTHLLQPSSDARTSLAAVSLDAVRGKHQLTLLDQQVNATALQRGSRNVRGVHYRSEGLELHAGLIASVLYRDFIFAPDTSGKLASASYQFKLGSLSIGPQAAWYSSGSGTSGTSGFAPGIQMRHASGDGRFRASGELGYASTLAAAGSFSFDNARHHLTVAGDHVPPAFPLAGGGPPPGSSFRGELRSRLSSRVSFGFNAEGDRRLLATTPQRTGSSSADIKVGLSPGWSMTAGSTVSVFQDEDVRFASVSVPVGLSWNGTRTNVSGIARYQQNTSRNRGGLGGRVHANGRIRDFTFTGSVDYQREAATVALVFREAPELARLFAELGFAARTPEELSRLLQQPESSGLTAYLQRATTNLSPWRLQLRADASWNPGARVGAVRFALLSDRTASTSSARDHLMGTLTYTRPVAGRFELTGSGSWWLSETAASRTGRWNYGLGIRVRFDGRNGFASMFRRQTIRGHVFSDDGAQGTAASAQLPLAGVRVVLDGDQETETAADGQFAFNNVRSGPHRVEAILPSIPGLRFSTPSVVQVVEGQPVTFGIGRVPARVFGYVRDDAGVPVPSVKLTLRCGTGQTEASTDSSGRYSMSGPEGPCSVTPDASSVPAGYDAAGTQPVETHLAAEWPVRVDHVVTAQRSLSGIAPATQQALTVTIRREDTEVTRKTDRNGRFVFRNLKPGVYTLSVVIDGRTVERRVEMPPGPAVFAVDLRPGK